MDDIPIPFNPAALDRLPYPIEPLRHWYLTPYGGTSPEIEKGHIGINARALKENTDLEPHTDKVLISEGVLGKPLAFKEFHIVVPLDENMPDALSKSTLGEAVLSERGPELVRHPELPPLPGKGATLILNAVISKASAQGRLNLSDGAVDRFQSDIVRILLELQERGVRDS